MTHPHRPLAHRVRKIGLPPGSVIHTGERKVEHAVVEVVRYDADTLLERREEATEQALAELLAAPREPAPTGVTWINVTGLHDTDLVERIGAAYGLHPLTLEDLVSVGQRPKVEAYEHYLFIVLRMLRLDAAPTNDASPNGIDNEQLGMVLLGDTLITFQERPGDVFDPVRERLRRGKGRIRRLGADYLAYALADVIVDGYFAVLERYSDRIEALEEAIFDDPRPEVFARISRLKRETLFVRKAVWPVREMLSALQREESALLSATVSTFLRDVHDHAIQAIDTLETLRELLTGLQDAYLSSLSYRMNEVMKVLTIIATIFIPLGFLVGVYGMNFAWMPELRWRWGYPLLWLLMLSLAGGMLAWFRRRGWL